MISKQFRVLGGIGVVLLAGCASTADGGGTVPAQASASVSCRSSEPTTGTSIRRRDCSSDAKTVSADDSQTQRNNINLGGAK